MERARILYIEDDPITREELHRLLQRLFPGWSLVEARTFREGWNRIANEGPFTLILSDQHLGEMQYGSSLMSELLRHFPDKVPRVIILMSAHWSPELVQQLAHLDAHLITKTADWGQLIQILQQCGFPIDESHRKIDTTTR